MAESNTLDKIRTMVSAGHLGTLAETVLFLAHQDSHLSSHCDDSPISDVQALEGLKKQKIHVSFQTFDMAHQKELKEMAGEMSKGIPIRKYGMNIRLEGNKYGVTMPRSSHFNWNGSWEGLDDQMKKDATALREMGFNINYTEYNSR